jgi:hypothetical protein
MDLSTLSASETAVIKLLHPATGEPLTDNGEPLTVTVYAPGSRQHQQMRSTRDRRIMAAAVAANKAGKKPADLTDHDKERADIAADLAACTASIGGWDYKGATDATAIRSAYADASMGWLADQVSRALGDWATFLPESATA